MAIQSPTLYGIKVTPRDHEVLRLLCAGLSNKEIGEDLGISPRTVKQHIRYFRYRMRLGGERIRVGIMQRCYEERLCDPGERRPLCHELTPTERRVATMAMKGFLNKEIGRLLNQSEQVVKNHMRVVFDKCGVWSRAELASRYTV